MCTPSICLVLSYQDLFFSFITHSLPAPSIYTLQFLHLPIRIRCYCCAGKACDLSWLLFSCLRSLSTLLKCCQGMGGLAYSVMQLPRLHCFWYLMQVAWTGTIFLSFAVHFQLVAWWEMSGHFNSMSCIVFRVLILSENVGKTFEEVY